MADPGSGPPANARLHAPLATTQLKARYALLRCLHHTSLYKRRIITNDEKGTHTNVVGHALHKQIISNPKERATLLKIIYGQLYNG